MHDHARQWVERSVKLLGIFPVSVLDLGGQDVNGNFRERFTGSVYHTLDISDHPSVDIVADARTWDPGYREYDLVICTEVFEHCERWEDIVRTAWKACRRGGWFITTMAGPGRPPHAAGGAEFPPPGEWYKNVEERELLDALCSVGFVDVTTNVLGRDLRGRGRRP